MKTIKNKQTKTVNNKINRLRKGLLCIMMLALLTGFFTSCGSSKTAKGASAGAIVGGLVGGWDGLATGALVGGGVGLMADSADDKKIKQEQKEREIAALEKSSNKTVATPSYKSNDQNVLNGTTWRLVSMVDKANNTSDVSSFVLNFQSNTKATTIILNHDGTSETYSETYTLVGDTLIFQGKDYVTNSEYKINGNQLAVVTTTHRVVFEALKETA